MNYVGLRWSLSWPSMAWAWDTARLFNVPSSRHTDLLRLQHCEAPAHHISLMLWSYNTPEILPKSWVLCAVNLQERCCELSGEVLWAFRSAVNFKKVLWTFRRGAVNFSTSYIPFGKHEHSFQIVGIPPMRMWVFNTAFSSWGKIYIMPREITFSLWDEFTGK